MEEDWSITLSIQDSPDKAVIGRQKVFSTSPISIGRADNNDMVIPDPAVSRNHATLRVTNDYSRVFVTDMSTHGTEVSGRIVPKGRGTGFTIESGETIRIGDTLLRYEINLRPSVQATFVGKMDPVILNTPSPKIDADLKSGDIPEPVFEVDSPRGFSPLALTIIAICLALMIYLLFFTE